ncbi:MAG: DUF1460 domain-containing protein [Melioribacteraceae bacterium]|nr:DUF1460 domain-containing protein [Melioribacteraceae bacterium]
MKKLTLLFALIFIINLSAQAVYTQKDVEVCNQKFELAVSKSLADKPINEVIVELGKSFLGTDYEAHTLEKGEKEELIINLTGLDCYTYMESLIALARCIKSSDTSFENYTKEIESLRYRNGVMGDYPTRLHYASDWLYDAAKRGFIKDITKEIGGVTFENNVNFMSTHPESYKFLKNNDEFVKAIAETEKEISAREYFYIPQDEIESIEDEIQEGDLLMFTTSIKGLDIAHNGIAVKMDDGRIHVMHAPQVGTKVQISDKPLPDYVKAVKKQNGLIVARVLEP